MLYLEALNLIIRGAAKAAINDPDDLSDSAQLAKLALARSRKRILSIGWQFNTKKITLQPNTAGRVPVSNAYLEILFKETKHIVQVDEEDNAKYVWNSDNQDWETAAVAETTVCFDYTPDSSQFKLLPEKLASWIAHDAAAKFWLESKGTVNQAHEAKAIREQSIWMNTQNLGDIHDVTGFTRLRAAGQGGTSVNDPRTQTNL